MIVALLAACDRSTDAQEPPGPEGAAAAETAPQDPPGAAETLIRAWTGDLDGMVERRVIRALVPYSKTFYFIDGGTQRGISHDYMKAFEDALNVRRKTGNLRVHVVFVPTTRDRMLEQLNGGRGDVAVVDATISPERLALVDFTTPIATGIKEIVVTGPASPPIANLDDLAGKTVYVRPDSTREAHLRALSDQLVTRGLAPIDVQRTAPELEPEDLLEMVNAGLLPAVVVNRYYGAFWKQVFTDIVVREDLVISEDNDVGFAMRKDSPQLKAELDAFLATHRKGSEFGNVTLQKYLKDTKWVKNATNEAELAKFRELVGLFQKYSDEYGVDWILMAAQGYQESRLDQNVKSPVGAIGVMQVMPATGKDMGVGDITLLENNIRAGVKYIRFVMDEFYKDEPMHDKNKMLFAFAAYNAGPGRVRGLRKEAEARGLDPNVWFNNVEHLAAEKIGRETVTYVSNIYKYYIAYKLVNEQAVAREEAKAAAG
ncbi:MAG: transporter substrate-binding domain-containing protein [Steroidobacteraceae bacterium]